MPRIRRRRTDHIRILLLSIEIPRPEYRRTIAIAIGLRTDTRPVWIDLRIGRIAICLCDSIGRLAPGILGRFSIKSIDIRDHGDMAQSISGSYRTRCEYREDCTLVRTAIYLGLYHHIHKIDPSA